MTLGDVLQARLDALADADKVEQAKLAQGTATVQLYRAIAGGWGANASSPARSCQKEFTHERPADRLRYRRSARRDGAHP
jgi:hypothetical protein